MMPMMMPSSGSTMLAMIMPVFMPGLTTPVSGTALEAAGGGILGAVATDTAPPHLPQNFASSGFDWPQLGQNMMLPSQAFLVGTPPCGATSVQPLLMTHF